MKVLSYLNVSNMSNLEADSGYIFQKLLFHSIIKMMPDVEIYFICPKQTPYIDDRVVLIPIENDFFNKYSVRFNFPWNKFMEKAAILREVDFAIINQPELVSNFRAIFSVIGNNNVKIASYFHYVPIEKLPIGNGIFYTENMNHGGIANAIFSRQLESVSTADYCITCSSFAIEFIKSNAALFGKSIEMRSIPPPISMQEVDKQKTEKLFATKTLVYNHRLYTHYGTKLIFEWLSELYSERQDFEVLVTDPTGERSRERDYLDISVSNFKQWLKDLPFVKIKNIKSHSEYYRVLWKCYAGMAPLKPSALWSMSVVDLFACGKPVLSPDYACFPEMLNNYEPLIFENKKGFFIKMCDLLDNEENYIRASKYCRQLATRYTDSIVAEKFIDLF